MSQSSRLRPIQASASQRDTLYSPLVSVIVPIYNGEADLPHLLECLVAQTYPREQVEYLLVDNNSSDAGAELIQGAVTEYSEVGLKLRYLLEKEIQSSYAARNKGVRAARGEILAFTDADCRPQPQWLERLVQPFMQQEIGLVIGEIVALPGDSLLERHAEAQGVLSQKNTLAHPFYPYGQTANLAARKKAFAEVGLFRPYLTTGGDADMCWRIQKETSWQLHFAEDAIVRHRHRVNFRELRSQWRRYGRSNRYLHELHGVPLRPKVKGKDYAYLLSRWLLKELPVNTLKFCSRKASLVEIVSTPINVFGTWARDQGQTQAELPEKAKIIETL